MCPECHLRASQLLPFHLVGRLLQAGCPQVTLPLPTAERHEVFQSLPPISYDDLLDFHFAISNLDQEVFPE